MGAAPIRRLRRTKRQRFALYVARKRDASDASSWRPLLVLARLPISRSPCEIRERDGASGHFLVERQGFHGDVAHLAGKRVVFVGVLTSRDDAQQRFARAA